MVKKGDTLIEVALAIGIFSMVAISVVAVMVSGTSSTQTALETTLAREEIDTQAEALRFIHASYISNSDDDKNPFAKLWKEITKNAYDPQVQSNTEQYLQYSVGTCQEIYDSSDNPIRKGFVIDTYTLGALTKDNINTAYRKFDQSKFIQASTYPRLVYNESPDLSTNSESYLLSSVEGIYVLAVKDPKTTNIPNSNNKGAAYYDFYIRTCWYGTGSETPSTISTVIRLYDPDGAISR